MQAPDVSLLKILVLLLSTILWSASNIESSNIQYVFYDYMTCLTSLLMANKKWFEEKVFSDHSIATEIPICMGRNTTANKQQHNAQWEQVQKTAWSSHKYWATEIDRQNKIIKLEVCQHYWNSWFHWNVVLFTAKSNLASSMYQQSLYIYLVLFTVAKYVSSLV